MSEWKHYPDAPHPNPYDEAGPPDPDDLCPVCEKIRCDCPPEQEVSAQTLMAEARKIYSLDEIRAEALRQGYAGDGSMDDAGCVELALFKLLQDQQPTTESKKT